MRRVWIEWQESAVGGFGKLQVYAQDLENGEVSLGGILCRQLGEVKYGQQKRFSIEEEETKVFVIAGKVKHNASYEFVRIPEGREDVFLTGSKRGSSFRFENAVTEETRKPICRPVREPEPEFMQEPIREREPEFMQEPIREPEPEFLQESIQEPVPVTPKKSSRVGTNLLLAVSILCFLGAAVIACILGVRMFRSEPASVEPRQFRVEEDTWQQLQ